MTNAQQGTRMAEALISGDFDARAAARAALAEAPPVVTNAAAATLIDAIHGGGEAGLAACRVLAQAGAPRFGGKRFAELLTALHDAQSGELGDLAGAASLSVFQRGPDPEFLKKTQDASGFGPTNPLLRILSVGKRAWFIGVFGLASFIAIAAMFSGPGPATLAVMGLASLFALAVVIDAFKRRCPSCRTLLAGHLVSIEQTGSYESHSIVQTSGGPVSVASEVSTHRRTWRCPFCRHEWTS